MGDPSDPGRRRFMEIGICAISGVIAAVSGVALTRFAIGPSFKKELSKWVEIPFKDTLNAGFKKVVLEYETKEGWLTEHTKKLVYVKKTEGGQPIAVSVECSHLGCIVTWDAERKIFLIVCRSLHMLRVFIYGAYKKPREINWITGVLLLLLVLASGFTGSLLPWDQKAYWATKVGTSIMGTVPFIGEHLLKITRGGADLGAVTLVRFYSLHVMFLPLTTVILLIGHFIMSRKHGASVPL
jgi:hypothetical protein